MKEALKKLNKLSIVKDNSLNKLLDLKYQIKKEASTKELCKK